MQEVPIVFGQTTVPDLLLHFPKPHILAPFDLCQLNDALDTALFASPHERLAMAHSRRRLVLPRSLDEVHGDVAQATARRRRELPEVARQQHVESSEWPCVSMSVSFVALLVSHHITELDVD